MLSLCVGHDIKLSREKVGHNANDGGCYDNCHVTLFFAKMELVQFIQMSVK